MAGHWVLLGNGTHGWDALRNGSIGAAAFRVLKAPSGKAWDDVLLGIPWFGMVLHVASGPRKNIFLVMYAPLQHG